MIRFDVFEMSGQVERKTFIFNGTKIPDDASESVR